MKALLLSAGPGTRLRPISYTIPKNMVRIAGKPILQYIIEDLLNVGIKDIGIVVSSLKEEIIDYFGNGSKFGARISYIDQQKTLGTAHAVLSGESFVKSQPFLMCLADIIIPGGLANFINRAKLTRQNLVMVSEVPKMVLRNAGVVEVKDSKALGLQEKPNKPRSNLAIAGVYFFNSINLFNLIRKLQPGKTSEMQITDAIQSLINKGEEVFIFKTKRRYIDFGTFDGMLGVNRYLLRRVTSDKIVIGTGAEISKQARLRPPLHIGNNCKIHGKSEIGPFVSLGDNVIIRSGTNVKNSIVMPYCKISIKGTMEAGLIGAYSVITSKYPPKGKLKIHIADNSRINFT